MPLLVLRSLRISKITKGKNKRSDIQTILLPLGYYIKFFIDFSPFGNF